MRVFISTPEGERTLLARIERAEDLLISYDQAGNEDNTAAILGRFSKAEQKTTVIVAATGSSKQVIETIGFYLAKETNKALKSHVFHLAQYSKSERVRKKNKKRIYQLLTKHYKVT